MNKLILQALAYSDNGGTDTSDATAVAADILNGKTAYAKGQKLTGNIPSRNAQTYTPTTTNQTIAAGQYLAGAQTITGDANLTAGNIKKDVSIFGVTGNYEGTNVSDTTAVAADVLSGKDFYLADGTKTTGTMPVMSVIGNISFSMKSGGRVHAKIGIPEGYNSRSQLKEGDYQLSTVSAQTITPTTTDQTIAADQYLIGAQTISGDANLVSGNIKDGVSIFGVTGSYSGGGGVTVTGLNVTSNGTYTAPAGTAYSPVVVSVGGPAAVPAKDVNFFGFDGTLVYSYTAQEAYELASMPALPTYPGYTATSWNWLLADMQSQIQACGKCNVSVNGYLTDYGTNTIKLVITNRDIAEGRNFFTMPADSKVIWGEGGGWQTLSSNTTHTYTQPGTYYLIYSGTVNSGNIVNISTILGLQTDNKSIIYELYISDKVVGGEVGYLVNLERILLYRAYAQANAMTELNVHDCPSLKYISVGSDQHTMVNLHEIRIANCHALKTVCVPQDVPNAYITGCDTLVNFIPSIIDTTNSWTAWDYGEGACYDSGMNIVLMPETITSLYTSNLGISSSFAEYCNYPKFLYCYPTTPPTLTSGGSGNSFWTSVTIYVPASAVNTYKAASQWSNYASRIEAMPTWVTQ